MIKKDLIGREVLIQEADKQGVGTRPDVKAAIDNARQSIIINAMLADYVKKNPVKDADIKAEYDKYKSQVGDKEYHARHILVATEDEAKAIIAKLKGGAKFEELAKQVEGPGFGSQRRRPGLGEPGPFVPEFSKAMTSLQKGAITETPVKTQLRLPRDQAGRRARAPRFRRWKKSSSRSRISCSSASWQPTANELMPRSQDPVIQNASRRSKLCSQRSRYAVIHCATCFN
jgi:hypothetical protein